ncbi:hypothetical protein ABB55_11690 [Prosthecomicrobium hirschii]|uniref:CHAD domain-containing protein n=1 Tax=Prosthecodimorpha hirschii TaxID=665126 RepID=A0A0P6VNB1_9HYPH|nr:CHAD domain-containing protein [Prosthecomicrobium hirschii]KPL52792.1 hypothetical protein ABB55_11690 [Prosthecomicrobium hirschii]
MPMPFRLDPHEPFAAGLKRILMGEIAVARAAVAVPRAEQAAGIHRARRALKRARSVLLVFRPLIGEDYRRRRDVLRDAADHLSAARDADAMVASAQKLDDRRPHDGAGVVIGRLSRAAEIAHAQRPDTGRVAALLRIAEADAASLPLAPAAGRLFVEALGETYRRGRADWRKAEEEGGEDVLHDWRKRVKHRWHLSLLVVGRTAVTSRSIVGDLDELGELLGDEHDLALLVRRLGKEADVSGSRKAARHLAEEAERRRRKLARRACELGAELYGDKTRHFLQKLDGLATDA